MQAGPGLDLLPEVFYDLKGRVILHEEVEGGFVFIYEAANRWRDDFSEIGVHHELDGKVAYFLKDETFVYFLLDRGILESHVT